jgi:thymidine phosphorylase
MSKKLAEGIDALVLDVKVGSGAFLKRDDVAASVAQLLVETGEQMGKRTVALLTNMNQPLGFAVGNALEVAECVKVLRGAGPIDVRNLTIELSAWMFYLGKRTRTVEEGRKLASTIIAEGSAFKKFLEMVGLQGGDTSVLENTSRLPKARGQLDIISPVAGYITEMNAERIGTASLVLGGGRTTKEDVIDPAVGITVHKKIGDWANASEPLCTLHYNTTAALEEARLLVLSGYFFDSKSAPRDQALVRQIIGAQIPSGVVGA